MARHMTRLRNVRVRQGGAVFFNVNDEAYDRWTGTTLNPVSASLLDQTLAVLFPSPDISRRLGASEHGL